MTNVPFDPHTRPDQTMPSDASPHPPPAETPPRVLQHLAFEADGGIQVGYYDPATDITTTGTVHLHTLVIAAGHHHDDALAAVHFAIRGAIHEALQDWP